MKHSPVRALYLYAVLMLSALPSWASESAAFLTQLLESIQSGLAISDDDRASLYEQLSLFDEDSFRETQRSLSKAIRSSRNRDTAVSLAQHLPSQLTDLRAAQFEVTLYYDLMALAEFQVAFNVLQSRIATWQQWQPETEAGRSAQGNLLHIFGQLLVRKEQVTDALTYFAQAEELFTQIDPNHSSIFTIQVIVAEAYLQGEYYEKALYFLERANQLFPKDRTDGRSYVAALDARAHLYAEGPEAALEVIQAYLDNPIDPREDYFLFFSLVHLEVLQHLEYTDEFLQLAERTNQLAEKIGNADYLKEAAFNLGYAHFVEGRLSLAIRYLEEAVTKDPDIRNSVSLQTYKYLGEAYARNEEYRKAYYTYRKYEQLFTERETRLNQRAMAEISAQYDLEKAKTETEAARVQMALVAERESARDQYVQILKVLFIALIVALLVILIALLSIKRKNLQLKKLSTTDPLTQVGNRLAMTEDVERHPPSLVCLVDIDKLKFYNDEYGHEVGDALIQRCTHLLRSHTQNMDIRMYRLGGDEFVLLSNSVPADTMTQLLSSVESGLRQQGYEQSGLSFGLADETDVTGFSKLLSLADRRMYEMKAEKRQ